MKCTTLVACLALVCAGTASAQIYLGPVNPAAVSGSGSQYSYFPDGLVFNVLSPTTIISVDCDPGGAGNVVVNLLDSALNVLQTATVPVAAGGLQTIPLGFNNIQPGTGYQLHANGSTVPSLYRNTAGAIYPYSAPGQIDITATINGLGTSGYYYFFYNWCIAAPLPPTYPGTPGGDLQMLTGVNGPASGFPWIKSATAFDTINLVMKSQGGTYNYQPFVLLGQPFTTGFPPNATIPGLVWLDLTQPYVVLINIDPFLTQFLDPGGTPYSFTMPPGFVGQSFLFQGACVTPALSITDGFEIQVL